LNLLKNNKAFSLVEILVAVGLTSIVAVGVTNLISNTMKAQRGMQAKDIQREVMTEIASHLGNKTACLNSFGGSNPSSSFTKSVIKDALNADKYMVGATHASNLVQYKQFKIENWQPDAGYTNQGRASLSVKLFKLGDVIGVRDIEQKIGLTMKLDASNNISECFSVGTNANGFWLASPTNLGDIYFGGGNVGIGTTSPAYKFEVSDGTVRAAVNPNSALSSSVYGSISNHDTRIITNNSTVLTATAAGNVGIGTTSPGALLDVGNGASQCCSSQTPNISLAQNSNVNGNFSWLQFHNGGESEAYIRLAGGGTGARAGQRRLEIGDSQGVGTSLTITGNVGIGTTAPATKLDVAGGVNVAGSVSVAGGVKIGFENTCDGGTAGTLRYNSGNQKMEYCNGSAWATLAVESGAANNGKIGKIEWVSGWAYGCEAGYHPAGYHASVGNSNNTIVMQCVKDGY
jgi:type II secretory pathway pseudopilin PulG